MTPGFAAYKRELMRVGLPLRIVGLVVVLAGSAMLVLSTRPESAGVRLPGYVALGFGWAILGYVIRLRTQWARTHPFTGAR